MLGTRQPKKLIFSFAALIPLAAISKCNHKVILMAGRVLSSSVQVLMSYQTRRTDKIATLFYRD
jgi:hypothetical protein